MLVIVLCFYTMQCVVRTEAAGSTLWLALALATFPFLQSGYSQLVNSDLNVLFGLLLQIFLWWFHHCLLWLVLNRPHSQ